MNFISLSFAIFLLFGAVIYYCIPQKAQWIWLLLLSGAFYFCFGVKMFFFLCFSIGTSFYASIKMDAIRKMNRTPAQIKTKKRIWLISALVLNLGVLLFLKFYNYTAHLTNLALARTQSSLQFPAIQLIIPVGISFYTLQIAAYCIDVYHEKYIPEKNLAKYALFVSFFPQILQGPIPRFQQLAHQFTKPHPFQYTKVTQGMQLILWGVFQKMVIADRAAIFVNHVFDSQTEYAGFQILIASFLYTLQIYADFSGCVDIARGVAQMFDIQLEKNFNNPYTALSIQNFWRKWHISFSSWLRDYVYIPLGGNRKGRIRKNINIMTTFLVSGIWHGVGLHYIVWGLLHGGYQVIGAAVGPALEKLRTRFQYNNETFSYKFFKWFITINLINFAWIFFRASSLRAALQLVRRMFSTWNPWVLFDGSLYTMGLSQKNFSVLLFGAGLLFIINAMQKHFCVRQKLAEQALIFRWGVYLLGIFSILFWGIYGPGYSVSQFIYGQF